MGDLVESNVVRPPRPLRFSVGTQTDKQTLKKGKLRLYILEDELWKSRREVKKLEAECKELSQKICTLQQPVLSSPSGFESLLEREMWLGMDGMEWLVLVVIFLGAFLSFWLLL